MNKIWSDAEKQYIKENATIKDEDLRRILIQMTKRNISLQSLRKQRRKLGIIKKQGRGISQILQQPLNQVVQQKK